MDIKDIAFIILTVCIIYLRWKWDDSTEQIKWLEHDKKYRCKELIRIKQNRDSWMKKWADLAHAYDEISYSEWKQYEALIAEGRKIDVNDIAQWEKDYGKPFNLIPEDR